jgi:two-component system, chemotaxis family, chemotaxis protein CheY
MKILLVDDSRTMRNIQKKVLGQMLPGSEFGEAGDGCEALDVISKTPGGFDLALVDWNMPNMDGLTLVHKIRATDRKTLLVMVTTESEKTRVLDAIKAGVNNYVIKPFTPETLTEKVRVTIERVKAAA